jgi:exodeoxyribonuclease III
VKITTWNINGLRAVLGKNAWEPVRAENSDIFCLQEVKARPEQLSPDQHQQFAGFQAHWNPAQRPGYSGVITLLKESPLAVEMGLGYPEFDTEGRVICTRHPGFLLFNIYFPNGQRGQDRVDFKLDFYARLLERCDKLHAAGEKIVLCGDFNTAHKEIDLANPRENSKTSGFLPEERVWLDCYLQHGFVDAFRSLYPDRVQYTWWTYITNARARNVGWRLDFFMVSEALLPRVKDVVIHDQLMGSDHCPVSILID